MKIAFPLLALVILSACASPQVTVTSEVTVTSTPLPTEILPTLTPTPIAVDGIAEDAEGNKLAYLDGEWVALPEVPGEYDVVKVVESEEDRVDQETQRIVAVDADGKEVYALDMSTGIWLEAESPAMQQTTALIEKYNINLETVTVTEEGHLVKAIDNETGKVLFQSNGVQNWYGLEFAVDTIAAISCESTPFESSKDGLLLAKDTPSYFEYMDKLMAELNIKPVNGARSMIILINSKNGCWGYAYNHKDFIYRDKGGVAHRMPLITITEEEKTAFLKSRVDK